MITRGSVGQEREEGGREKTSVEQTVTVTGRAQSDCGTRATQVQDQHSNNQTATGDRPSLAQTRHGWLGETRVVVRASVSSVK